MKGLPAVIFGIYFPRELLNPAFQKLLKLGGLRLRRLIRPTYPKTGFHFAAINKQENQNEETKQGMTDNYRQQQ